MSMKTLSPLLAVALLCASAPLRAQVAAPAPPSAESAPAKPKPSCPCDSGGFKPLTEKAAAVQEYWKARRKVKISVVVSGTGLMLSLLARDGQALQESVAAHDRALEEMRRARRKAEELGALKVTGDDLDGEIEFRLEKGVDYTLAP